MKTALVKLIEDDKVSRLRGALSFCSMRVRIPSVTTSHRVRLLTTTSKRSDTDGVARLFVARKESQCWATERAANLRGSSMIILLPCNHGSSNSINGRTYFSAPGGAWQDHHRVLQQSFFELWDNFLYGIRHGRKIRFCITRIITLRCARRGRKISV